MGRDGTVGGSQHPFPATEDQRPHIVEGDALRMDWEDVVPKNKLNYIIGNPPFVGKKEQTKEQKAKLVDIMGNVRGTGNSDYVMGWYKKATELMNTTQIRVAFTFICSNSITQGEQAPIFGKLLLGMGAHIDFAYCTFRWDSEARLKAHVHCVIIG